VILNRLSLFDGDREKRRSLRRQVQLVFQDAAGSLNPWRRVGATVAEGIKVHRLAVGEAVGVEVVRLFEEVGLAPDSVDRFPNQLSGGQRQRVGLARALAVGPEVLVADEPLSALDVSVQTRILELLADLKSKDGMTVVLISHDLAAVRLLADRIAVMYLGRVVEVAPSKAILSSPAHPYTQMLLESVPEADPNIRTRSAVIYGEPPNPASPPKGCAFHPRCPNADASCQTTRPQLKTVAHGHDVACLLVPESG
jgi:oligopeptide/dipeptide ABC transporter ATP-binding protein